MKFGVMLIDVVNEPFPRNNWEAVWLCYGGHQCVEIGHQGSRNCCHDDETRGNVSY